MAEQTSAQEPPFSASRPFIEARGVRMSFGSTQALDKIDLTIREHEFFTIVGPSGCGKSTLLLLAAGLLQPTEGVIAIDGRPIHAAYTNAGIAFQHHNLLEWRSILGNVLLPLEIRHMETAPFLARARDLLNLVGLAGFENHFPHQLSGGMRQRAALCRALVCDLPLLLMDEPFGALDALSREEHQLMLQEVWMRERKTVLLITHDIREAILLSDRIAVMGPRPGRILDIVDIDLPRPRHQDVSETPEFIAYVRRLRAMLFAKPVTGATP